MSNDSKKEMDPILLFTYAIRDGVAKGIADRINCGYNSPIEKTITALVEQEIGPLREILGAAVKKAIEDPGFRETINEQIRVAMAKTLIQKFGGEIEKHVNALKSDASTRARITVAIDDIIKSQMK